MSNASNVPHFQQKSLQGFTFPSWDRVLIYLCALFIVCWSVGPFLWQMSTSIQPDRELMSATPHIFPNAITFEHFVWQELPPIYNQFQYSYNNDHFSMSTLWVHRRVRTCSPRYPRSIRISWVHSWSFDVPADRDRWSALRSRF
jgi:hypothetical protein